MASPFNIFRRNQRIMMVVLTGLSMFAFLFFDVSQMKSGGVSKSLIVAFFAALCGAGLWFVGSRRGQGTEWALWGALLGAVAAFLFVRTTGPETVVQGAGIQVTDLEMSKLRDRRMKVNHFVYKASEITKSPRPAQGFGTADDQSMVQYLMGRKEAQRLGISLSDHAVNQYLREITDDKMSQDNFREILQDLNVSEGDVFRYLKEELEVRLALDIQSPPYDTWLDFAQRMFRPMLPPTPAEQWETFRRLNVKQSLSVVAIPVSAFERKVEEPTEVELLDLFNKRKGQLPSQQGDPGFMQPRRVQLAYLSADYDKFESQVAAPTEDDIKAYYEANKATRYSIREFPDMDLNSDQPADAIDPENQILAIPVPTDAPVTPPAGTNPPADTSPPVDTPAKPDAAQPEEVKPEESKPDAAQPEKPAEEKPAPEKPAGDGQAAGRKPQDQPLIQLVSFATEEATPDAAAETKLAAAESQAAEPAATTPNAETQPELPVTAETANDPFPVELPSPTTAAEAEGLQYRELNDDLKETIRGDIIKDRAAVLMNDAANKAQKKMEDLATRFQGKEDQQLEPLAKEAADQLKEYAASHNLTYVETKLQSLEEMQNSLSEQIGKAFLGNENTPQTPSVVSDLFFGSGQSGVKYLPQRANSHLRTHCYAYWVIKEAPQHEPEWKEEGVKEQVIAAWKYQQAQILASKRAQELVELAKQNPKDLSAAFSGQTVTGEPGTDSVTIKETPRFSWMTTEMTTPFDPNMGDFMAPRISFINGVDQQGNDFMELVCDKLQVGEVGAGPNFRRTEFYIVQVRDRDATEPARDDLEDFKTVDALRNQYLETLSSDRMGFATRAYNLNMSNTLIRLQQEWSKTFTQRYGIELEKLQPASRRRQARR